MQQLKEVQDMTARNVMGVLAAGGNPWGFGQAGGFRLGENPWDLPEPPEGYDTPPWRKHLPELPALPKPSLRQINALLNLALSCCIIFLCLVFPVLLYQSLSDSNSVLGWRFLVVTSASMEPDIRTGALLLAKEVPFDRLEEGDVIVFSSGEKLITHRIIGFDYGAAITKGDAALLPDAMRVTPEMYRCQVRKVFNGFAAVTRALTE